RRLSITSRKKEISYALNNKFEYISNALAKMRYLKMRKTILTVNNIEELLEPVSNALDHAIKRLVAPASIIVAAIFLRKLSNETFGGTVPSILPIMLMFGLAAVMTGINLVVCTSKILLHNNLTWFRITVCALLGGSYCSLLLVS